MPKEVKLKKKKDKGEKSRPKRTKSAGNADDSERKSNTESFFDQFDVVISLDVESVQKVYDKKMKSFIRKACKRLKEGLGERVDLCKPSYFRGSQIINFGLTLDPNHMLETLIRGPPGDTGEAVEFRKFWGEKSELRRFQDGAICEAVFFESKTLADRRAIVGKISKFILKKHFNLDRKASIVSGSQLDSFLWPAKVPPPNYGTGEEANRKIISNFEGLSKKLRALKDLPLTLSSVQGVSPAFRGTEVFPDDPVPPNYQGRIYGDKENCVSFAENTDNITLKHLKPIDVIIHLETSGKWPSDLEALKRVKAAFIMDLSETISNTYGLLCKPQKRHLDIWHESIVFRCHFACNKETHLMRHIMTPQGMIKTIESPEADELTKFQIHLPIITSALHSVNTRFSTYSAVTRLAKCWISRHLLWDNIDEVAIELMVAYLYLNPAPYSAPMSPLTGFTRFLKLLVSFPWNRKPLIVNFNNQLNMEEILEIEGHFKENRDSLPPIFIANPFDKNKSFWTQEKPSQVIVNRLKFLASKCYEFMQTCFENLAKADFRPLFQTTTEIYDLTIHLDKHRIPNFNLNLNFTRFNSISNKQILSYQRRKEKRKMDKFPIVDFNSVKCFLKELRTHFGRYALFFYDEFGGSRIYLIWKPHTFDSKPLHLSNVLDCKLTETTSKSGKPNVIFNAEAVMEDLYILGDGLVSSIDANVSKWE